MRGTGCCLSELVATEQPKRCLESSWFSDEDQVKAQIQGLDVDDIVPDSCSIY